MRLELVVDGVLVDGAAERDPRVVSAPVNSIVEVRGWAADRSKNAAALRVYAIGDGIHFWPGAWTKRTYGRDLRRCEHRRGLLDQDRSERPGAGSTRHSLCGGACAGERYAIGSSNIGLTVIGP
jgi:hypothetical protein